MHSFISVTDRSSPLFHSRPTLIWRFLLGESLVKRLDAEVVGEGFTVKPVEKGNLEATVREMTIASYGWRFDPADFRFWK